MKMEEKEPCRKTLYKDGDIPDVVLLRGDNRGMMVWAMGGDAEWRKCKDNGFTHWMPIPAFGRQLGVRDAPAEDTAERQCNCKAPVINITLNGTHFPDGLAREEFRAWALDIIKLALSGAKI